ncbi:MAG: hypothetical protein AAFQ07_01870 [Chloroflexota bacterium]
MRYLVFLCTVFMLTACFRAQDSVTGAPESNTQASAFVADFEIFTLDAPIISGVAPIGWETLSTGNYVRDSENDGNTYILHFANNQQTIEESLAPILTAFEQDSLPTESTTLVTSAFEWTLYTFTYTAPDSDQPLQVDIATTTNENTSFVIVMQTTPEAYTELHETIFLSSVQVFGLPQDDIRVAMGISALTPITVQQYGIDTAYPDGWQAVNPGSWSRGDLQEDPTTLIVQTSSDLSARAFRDLFAEQLAITTEGQGDTYNAPNRDWRIFTVTVSAQGIPLTWQIASAEDNQFAYLVVLLTHSDEAEALRESVLLPVLDATNPTA